MKENWEINWKDYYDILGVSPQSKIKEIESAYKKLAKKFHPDVDNSTNATQKMKDLNEAEDILGDIVKKSRYDIAFNLRKNINAETNTTQPTTPTKKYNTDLKDDPQVKKRMDEWSNANRQGNKATRPITQKEKTRPSTYKGNNSGCLFMLVCILFIIGVICFVIFNR